jgi:hypothetical protein
MSNTLDVSGRSTFYSNVDLQNNDIDNVNNITGILNTVGGLNITPVLPSENVVIAGGNTYYIFSSVGIQYKIVIGTVINAEVIAMGGGGGGSVIGGLYTVAGGGGAGGLQTTLAQIGTHNVLTSQLYAGVVGPITMQPGTYFVTVGAGGVGSTVGVRASNGSDTTITGPITLRAKGGGGGSLVGQPGGIGGCGGGGCASGNYTDTIPGQGTQGYAGGNPAQYGGAGAGGGGVRGVGGLITNFSSVGGDGGPGYTFPILAFTSPGFGGGGGGSGGNGGNATDGGGSKGVNGIRGGGGGGGGSGTAGGNGFLIIRIPTPSGSGNFISATGSIIPSQTDQYSLGAPGARWLAVYALTQQIRTSTLDFVNASGEQWSMSIPNGGLSITATTDTLTSIIPGAMASPNVIVAAGTNLDDYSRSPIQVSVDGTAWAILDVSGTIEEAKDVAFDGKDTWVAVGNGSTGGGVAVNSTNGNVWSLVKSGLHDYQSLAVCYSKSDNRWYATGYDSSGRNVIVRSKTNLTAEWEPMCQDQSSAYFGHNSALTIGVSYAAASTIATDGRSRIVAGGYPGEGNSAILWADTKVNGAFWYNATDYDTNANIQDVTGCIAYNGNIWLAAATGIYVSRDGKVWKKSFYSGVDSIRAVEWNGQYWLANGYTNIYKSYDGYVWDLFVPSSSGFFNCLGWNGTRWLTGGYAIGTSGIDTMQSLTATDTEWKPCTDFTDTTNTQLFGQVNNFANRVLLPNSPPPPATAIITSDRPPTTNDGNIGDTWVYKAVGVPINTYGPKFEDVSYGQGGSVYFGSDNRSYAVTASGSSNYDIGVNDYTINWWMNVPQRAADFNAGVSYIFNIPPNFAVGISGDRGIYSSFSEDTVYMNADVDTDSTTWQFCTLTRSNGTTNFYINGSNTYNSDSYSNTYLGNNSTLVGVGTNMTSLLMTNFRWTTGYSDPSAAYVPTAPLTTISGTVLLFTMSDGPSAWTDSAFNTSMTVPTGGAYNQPLTVWSGLTPFATVNVSWGAPQPRPPYQFVGFGEPASDPPGSIPGIGDTYTNLATGDVYDIVP